MIPRREEDLRKVERALAEAHRARPDPVLEKEWAQRVMSEIRQDAGGHRPPILSSWIEGVVWRAASIAVMLAVILAGSAMFYAGQDEGVAAALASDEFDAVVSLIE